MDIDIANRDRTGVCFVRFIHATLGQEEICKGQKSDAAIKSLYILSDKLNDKIPLLEISL